MQTVLLPQIDVDISILKSLKNTKEEFINNMKLYTAIVLYKKNRLSLGKAAEFLGVDKLTFLDILKKEGVAIFDFLDEDIKKIDKEADELVEFL